MAEKLTMPNVCFAPPLTDEKLEEYGELIQSMDAGPVKDTMQMLLDCAKEWWKLPDSQQDPVKYTMDFPVGRNERGGVIVEQRTVNVVPMEKEHIKILDPKVPWMHECEALDKLFGELPSGVREVQEEVQNKNGSTTLVGRTFVTDRKAKAIRDAAHHLLWHAKEFALDREPTTQDKLPKK